MQNIILAICLVVVHCQWCAKANKDNRTVEVGATARLRRLRSIEPAADILSLVQAVDKRFSTSLVESGGTDVDSRLAATRQVLGKVRLMVVIKNVEDPVAWARKVLDSPTKVDYFGVQTVKTALKLRSDGIQTPLLVLYPGAAQAEDCGALAAKNIELAVASWAWAEQCAKFGKPALHIFVDTGHGVTGLLQHDAVILLGSLLDTSFEVRGFMSHLCCETYAVREKWYANLAGKKSEKLEQMHLVQSKRIVSAMSALQDLWSSKMPDGATRPLVHVAASGSVTQKNSALFYDMVRVGRYIVPDENKLEEVVHQKLLNLSTDIRQKSLNSLVDQSPEALLSTDVPRTSLLALSTATPWRTSLEQEDSLTESARDVEFKPYLEKVLPPGWCVGYYCWQWPGTGALEIFDQDRRFAVVMKEFDGPLDNCREAGTDLPIPLVVDYSGAGTVFDLASVSPKRPLIMKCQMAE